MRTGGSRDVGIVWGGGGDMGGARGGVSKMTEALIVVMMVYGIGMGEGVKFHYFGGVRTIFKDL